MTEHADAGDGVGEELARARAALGLSVADVAQKLKFAARQIEALEQDRFEQLPAGTFARGMVRSYARLLKLDAEPLVARIAGRTPVPDNAAAIASVRHSIPITDSARRSNLVYAAFSLAILGLIAGVVFEWQRERSGAARLSFVPAAQAPAEPQRLAASSAGAVVLPNTAPLAEAEPAPPAAQRGAEGKRRINMKFERVSWVEIKDGGGRTLISQLNPAGSQQAIEGRPPFEVIIGNAQHVRLSYDDRPIDLAPHVKVAVARFTLE